LKLALIGFVLAGQEGAIYFHKSFLDRGLSSFFIFPKLGLFCKIDARDPWLVARYSWVVTRGLRLAGGPSSKIGFVLHNYTLPAGVIWASWGFWVVVAISEDLSNGSRY
jgi:hypothetical protein